MRKGEIRVRRFTSTLAIAGHDRHARGSQRDRTDHANASRDGRSGRRFAFRDRLLPPQRTAQLLRTVGKVALLRPRTDSGRRVWL